MINQEIYINGRFLCQPKTGVQRYANETLRELDALANKQQLNNFTLVVPNGVMAPPLNAIKVKKIGFGGGYFWEQFWLLFLVRSSFLINFNYTAPIFKKNQLVTVHDVTPIVESKTFSKWFRLAFLIFCFVLIRRAKLVMSVSNFSAAEIRKYFNVSRDIVVGVEGGDHFSRLLSDESDIKQRFGIGSKKYILLVGSLKPNKNIALVSKALKYLDGLEYEIFVVGAEDNRIFSSADRFSNISFLGKVSDPELAFLYKNASWYLFPSLYEGFGLPAVEAFWFRCPLLCARITPLIEVCGDAALYFDPRNPKELADLLRNLHSIDEGCRHELREKGVERLQHYNWGNNANILMTLLMRMPT